MNKSRGSPRKFSEKIALLNKKEAEATAEFEKIIKEVEETTRAPTFPSPQVSNESPQCSVSNWIDNGYYSEAQVGLEPVFNSHHQYPSIVQQQQNQSIHLQQHQIQLSPNALGPPMHHQLPDGVPNIEIIPICDGPSNDNSGQQVPYMGSNLISSARSLPDIANLRVSTTFNQLNPSYSDQRIPAEYDYKYDANSNIVSDPNNRSQAYCSHVNNQQDQLQAANSWDPTLSYNHQIQNSHSQIIHHNYYQQQSQPEPMVRANSTNTVLNSWQNSDTLNPQTRLNCNLSKSSEVCLGCPEHDQTGNNRLEAGSSNYSQFVTNHRLRSSSYNNIENIDIQNGLRIQHPQHQQQPQQQLFVGTHQYHH